MMMTKTRSCAKLYEHKTSLESDDETSYEIK